jgi:hypothetical protein
VSISHNTVKSHHRKLLTLGHGGGSFGLLINHGRTVQRKTTIISFTCIAEINLQNVYTQSHTFKFGFINL